MNSTYSTVNDFLVKILKIFLVFFISLRIGSLPHHLFKDRVNYLFNVTNSESYLSMAYQSKFVLLQEPLFKIINYSLYNILLIDAENILYLYALLNCVCVFTFIMFTKKSIVNSSIALIVLMITPYIYGSTVGALAQALGYNFILLSLMRGDRISSNKFALSIFIASQFHVIFYVFLSLVIVYRISLRIFKNEKISLMTVLFSIVIIGFLWQAVTPYLSKAQQYSDYSSSVSGATFIGWLLIFLFFLINYFYVTTKKLISDHNKNIYILSLFFFLCFLVFYWLAPGPYRILYSTIPLVTYSLFMNINKFSLLCIVMLLMYSLALHSFGAGLGSLNVSYSEFYANILSLSFF